MNLQSTRLQKITRFLALGAGLLVLIFLGVQSGWFMGMQNRLQNKFYDEDSASSEIILVTIDETSLQDLGQLPLWKRADYARVIEALYEAGAATVGIDLTLPDPSPHGKKDDETLEKTLEKYPNTVLAVFYDPQKRGFQWPNENLTLSPDQLGTINVQHDEDNFVRKLPLFFETERGIIEAFSLTLSRKYLRESPMNYAVQDQQFQFSQDRRIPVISQHDGEETVHAMLINYFARPYRFRQLSFVEALDKNWVDKEKKPLDLTDKIVLIGPTAIDLGDTFLSPVSQGVKMPGVEIHANALQTIIEGKFLRPQSPWAFWLTLIFIVIVNMSVLPFLKLRYALPLVIVEVFSFLVAGIVAYEWELLLNVVYPALLALASFVGVYLLRFILEQKERKFIENAFGHYVNKTVVKQIQQNPELLALGGTKREISVFFSDIAGFTTLSEQMQPSELVAFLNEYLHEMTEIILKHNGTLDKYEGDAIMAFWNAPVAQHDPALHACLAALENQEKLAQLRQKWKAEGKPQIHVRIGLNTGPAVVGNMGSKNRFDYTAMGDNVNLGSRLEGVNKFYGSEILMTEATYSEVVEHVVAREVDLIQVKGRKEPVRIYELQGKQGQVSEDQLQRNEVFAQALNLYRVKNFMEAKLRFASLKEDPVAQVFAGRCEDFLKTPPKEGWEGVWVFESK